MSEGADGTGDDPEQSVTVETEIDGERTVITVSGTRNAATVVRSESGERIYLPPEETADESATSPYRPTEGSGDSPYEGIQDDTPYGSSRVSDPSVGVNPTASGFRVIHPEPVTDVRFLR
ncbi:MAG: hypothetical protein ABEJ40_06695 [Haloarculaceae archaeon]